MKETFSQWTAEYIKAAENNFDLSWPSETLVRLFKGSYIPDMPKDLRGKRVLDISFGNGNNFPLMASLGLRLSGTEVTEKLCTLAREKFGKLGLEMDLRVGTNRNLPFADNEFDFLVSWNVLHYEDNEKHILAALQEYRRVLTPGGRFLISTTGPEHLILKGAETLGNHRYRINREDDFRKGQIFFYFDSPNYIHSYFDPFFREVHVGRTHDFLMTGTLDWWIIAGIK